MKEIVHIYYEVSKLYFLLNYLCVFMHHLHCLRFIYLFLDLYLSFLKSLFYLFTYLYFIFFVLKKKCFFSFSRLYLGPHNLHLFWTLSKQTLSLAFINHLFFFFWVYFILDLYILLNFPILKYKQIQRTTSTKMFPSVVLYFCFVSWLNLILKNMLFWLQK